MRNDQHRFSAVLHDNVIQCRGYPLPHTLWGLSSRGRCMYGITVPFHKELWEPGRNFIGKQTFPITQIHFPQARVQVDRQSQGFGQQFRGLAGPEQVARINGRNLFAGQLASQGKCLCPAGFVQARGLRRLSLPPSGEIPVRLPMADQPKIGPGRKDINFLSYSILHSWSSFLFPFTMTDIIKMIYLQLLLSACRGTDAQLRQDNDFLCLRGLPI